MAKNVDEIHWLGRGEDIMKKLFIISLILLSSCANVSSKISLGKNVNSSFDGGDGQIVFQTEYRFNEDYSCEYTHVSHLTSGYPFNNDHEEVVDVFSCSYNFSWKIFD